MRMEKNSKVMKLYLRQEEGKKDIEKYKAACTKGVHKIAFTRAYSLGHSKVLSEDRSAVGRLRQTHMRQW